MLCRWSVTKLSRQVGPVGRGAPLAWRTRIEAVPERAKTLLAAQARAALRAVDLSADIERRAVRLIAVAPGLRARGANVVADRLLSDDAIVASERIAGMSTAAGAACSSGCGSSAPCAS